VSGRGSPGVRNLRPPAPTQLGPACSRSLDRQTKKIKKIGKGPADSASTPWHFVERLYPVGKAVTMFTATLLVCRCVMLVLNTAAGQEHPGTGVELTANFCLRLAAASLAGRGWNWGYLRR
jgi:hypothetical protein